MSRKPLKPQVQGRGFTPDLGEALTRREICSQESRANLRRAMASAISPALTAGAYGSLTETVTGLLCTEKAGRRGCVCENRWEWQAV